MNFGKMIFRLDDEDEGGEGRATNDLTFAENRYDKLTAVSGVFAPSIVTQEVQDW